MFIGREAELKFLNDKYQEKKGQLMREDIPAKNYISEFSDWEGAFRAKKYPFYPSESLGCRL